MRIEEVAFVHLVRLAHSDRRLCAHEDQILHRYRKALAIPRRIGRRMIARPPQPPAPEEIEAGVEEKLQILKMMARVAIHDGVVVNAERRMLQEVAVGFGLSPLCLADIIVEADTLSEAQMLLRRLRTRIDRHKTTVGISLAALAMIVLVVALRMGSESSRGSRKMAALETDFEEVTRSLADGGLERLQQREQEILRIESELRRRVEAGPEVVSRAEFDRLAQRLDQVESAYRTFSRIEQDYDGSVVLVCVQYEMKLGARSRRFFGAGTGFIVSPLGHIVTNKHVVKPWLFSVQAAKLRDEGYELDLSSTHTGIWPAGTRVRDDNGKLDWSLGYSTWDGRLAIEKTAPDTFTRYSKKDSSGAPYAATFHSQDVGDLAVLRADLPEPVTSILLQPDTSKIAKVDPVMVLGFPKTFSLLQTPIAETAPSFGVVRKVEKKIFVDATIIQGNSGGPLLGLEGLALGVATTKHGDPNIGGCIPSHHVLPLLPKPAELLRAARRFRTACPRAALELLHLAEMRGPTRAELGAINDYRAPLLASIERRLAEAAAARDGGSHAACRERLRAIVADFGPYFGREARRLLASM